VIRFINRALVLSLLLSFSPASASGEKEARVLANCAWQNVPVTAAALSELRPKRNVQYEPLDSMNSGGFMRVYAACFAERKALQEQVSENELSYYLLKALARSRPKVLGADSFQTPVFRCEARFVDHEDIAPAAIWWGYGDDRFARQLGWQGKLFNSQVSITAADILAIEKRGNGAANFAQLLQQTEEQMIADVETHEEGIASKTAFRIKPTARNSKCQIVSQSGALIDA